MQIKIGADPEVFVKRNGKNISAHGMIKGDKKNPFRVNNGAVQVDGTALEFNIDPATDANMFAYNINIVMDQLRSMIEDTIVIEPVAHYGFEYLSQLPAEALELGCDPDFNAWKDGEENVKPDIKAPFRTGAGHIHIGFVDDADITSSGHLQDCCAVAKQMDFLVGLPSLFFDADTQRREMYGKAGAFRPKPYGVEYRTLSNAWLKDNELIKWVFNNSVDAVKRLMNGEFLFEKYGDIQDIINTSNKSEAKRIIKDANIGVCYAVC